VQVAASEVPEFPEAGQLEVEAGETSRREFVLDALSALARFGLAVMWIYSGSTKLGNHMTVMQSIEAYEIFTPYWSNLLANIIGPAEIAGGLILLLGIKIRPAGWVSVGVLVLFVIGLASAYHRACRLTAVALGRIPRAPAMISSWQSSATSA